MRQLYTNSEAKEVVFKELKTGVLISCFISFTIYKGIRLLSLTRLSVVSAGSLTTANIMKFHEHTRYKLVS